LKKRLFASVIITVLTCAVFLQPSKSYAANTQLVIDLSANTGAVKHGASGFLYGLGDEGIPTDNVLTPLNPQGTAQKAPDGLQHPNGDALKIAPQFKRNGGKDIQIYMQDIYKQWPYDNLGIDDYLSKVDVMVNKVVADANRSMYVYVPFNEPDGNWYSNLLNYSSITGSTARQKFFSDWKTVYERIRSLDASARIAGPNLTHYDSQFHSDFMSYAKTNHVLPDVMTWHELSNDFFTGYYNHYNHYRGIESSLGISARPIVINEYGRFSGDLGVPGNLVQWITRFENTKVDALLAYWTSAGALNDLVTENNKATGGWWLYKWYGEMTGNTVTVTPPSVNGSLQGLASLDSDKRQARIVFGGSTNSTDVFNADVVVKGFGSTPYFGNSVHAIVWGVDSSGLNPSSGPYFVQEGDYAVSGGQITVAVNSMKALSAYHMMITPNRDLSSANSTTRYEAEYASPSGSALVSSGSNTGYSGTSFVEGYGASTNASTNFVVTAPTNGYYNVTLRYSAGQLTGVPANRNIRMTLGGSRIQDISLTGTANWNTWASSTTKVFLTAGINRIGIDAYTTDDSDAINVDYIDIQATTGTITNYEAEASGNTRGGAAVITTDSAASGGKYVGYIGLGAANTLTINNVAVSAAGTYRMVITYANGELGDGATNYNSNIVDRSADISVNGGIAKKVYFRNTLGWSNYRTTVMDVTLAAGNNTIKFSNSSAYAPNIDKIGIAEAVSSVPFASASSPNSVKINESFDQIYGLFNFPDGIQSVKTTVVYDPNVLEYVVAEPIEEVSGLQVTEEPSNQPGQVILDLSNLSGHTISSGNLLKIHWKAKATEQLTAQITVSSVTTSNPNIKLDNTINSISLYADVSNITVNGSNSVSSITDNKGALQMKANVIPANADQTVTWSVTDLHGSVTDLALISPDGILTANGSGKNGSVKVTALANDGTGIKGEAIITIRNQLIPITGTPFGVGPAWSTGGEYDKAFDGNTNTYYDYYTANNGYTGIDLGEGKAKVVQQIRFYPRSGFTSRMVGGKFQGSNTSSTSGFVDLYSVSSNPPLQWNAVTITNPTAFRYLRYVAPSGGYGNVAEIEFYGPTVQAGSITVQGSGNSQAITEKSGTMQMSATIEPSDVGNKSVTWSVTNLDGTATNLATISENGLLFAKIDGKVRVIATADEGSGVQGEILITIDTEPPVTKALVSPAVPDGLNGWYNGSVNVTLTSTDLVSGVADTTYSLNGETTWNAYTAPIILDQDGAYTFSYRSTDKVGHVETTKVLNWKRDGTAPDLTLSVTETVYDSDDFIPSFTTLDNGSGVDASKTTITLDGQTLQQGKTIALYSLMLGSHTLIVTATDLAGNESSVKALFQVKTSLPSLQSLVALFTSSRSIDNHGVADSLQAKLTKGNLYSFMQEVQAQSGKHISNEAASILLRDAEEILRIN
jgi:hypothetical protein